MDLAELRDLLLGPGGTLVLTLLILYGGWRSPPWWVFGRHFQAVAQDRDEWKAIALRGTALAEKVVELKANGP